MSTKIKIKDMPIVVIGAGIAGLCVSYYLSKKKINHIILEKGVVGNTWVNERWDNFYLVNPNWAIKIPEFDINSKNFPSKDPNGFLSKNEVVKYLQSFSTFIGSKIHEKENVEQITKEEGGYKIVTSNQVISSKIIVLANGAFGDPYIPKISQNLDKEIFQIHSSEYKNPSQLPKGDIVVVGSGQSGAQIAEDLLVSGKNVWLAVSKCGRRPRSYRGKDSSWWNYNMGSFDKTVDQVPFENRWKCSPHTSGSMGGHDINLLDLSEKGLNLIGSINQCDKNKLLINDDLYNNIKYSDDHAINWAKGVDKFIDEKKMDTKFEKINPDKRVIKSDLISIDKLNLNKSQDSIIWSTGFRYNYDWIDLDISDNNNQPVQKRGITKYPGFYFMGLQWMHSSKSAQFIGVAEDAEFIVKDILSKNLF